MGVSGWSNTTYNPSVANSGANGGAGAYALTMRRVGAGSTSLSGITAAAASGTPRLGGVPSAHVGQTITLAGSGFVAGEPVVFLTSDDGPFGTTVATAATVAADGTSLTVVVPANATTGMVRLARENVGRLLQVVPTLGDVDQGVNEAFHDGGLRLRGTGFVEGGIEVRFGSQAHRDLSTDGSLNVGAVLPARQRRPRCASSRATSPAVRSRSARSAARALRLDCRFSGSSPWRPAARPPMSLLASANPGQAIVLEGVGFDATTDVVFQLRNGAGTLYERVVRPSAVDPAGTQLTVVVPLEATTGAVRVVGDQLGAAVSLQIVPTLLSVNFTSVSAEGLTAGVQLRGTGLVEGANSRYGFGETTMVDASPFSGPDVFGGFVHENDAVNLTLDISGNYHGAVRVTTNGGTSAPYSVGYTQLTSVAASGTPANPALASANPGQVVTLTGSGLSLATDLVGRWRNYHNAQVESRLLNPNFVDATGTQITVAIPQHFNGAFELTVLGSAFRPTLQIVPVVDSLTVTGQGAAQVRGRGFVEANSSQYTFGRRPSPTPIPTRGPTCRAAASIRTISSICRSRLMAAGTSRPRPGAARARRWRRTSSIRRPATCATSDSAAGTCGSPRRAGNCGRSRPTTGQTLATWSLSGGGASGTGLQSSPLR